MHEYVCVSVINPARNYGVRYAACVQGVPEAPAQLSAAASTHDLLRQVVQQLAAPAPELERLSAGRRALLTSQAAQLASAQQAMQLMVQLLESGAAGPTVASSSAQAPEHAAILAMPAADAVQTTDAATHAAVIQGLLPQTAVQVASAGQANMQVCIASWMTLACCLGLGRGVLTLPTTDAQQHAICLTGPDAAITLQRPCTICGVLHGNLRPPMLPLETCACAGCGIAGACSSHTDKCCCRSD